MTGASRGPFRTSRRALLVGRPSAASRPASWQLAFEKSLTDISREPSERFRSFRLAACLLLPIAAR